MRKHNPEIMTDVGMCHLSAMDFATEQFYSKSFDKMIEDDQFWDPGKGRLHTCLRNHKLFLTMCTRWAPTSCKWVCTSGNSRIITPVKPVYFQPFVGALFDSTYDWIRCPSRTYIGESLTLHFN